MTALEDSSCGHSLAGSIEASLGGPGKPERPRPAIDVSGILVDPAEHTSEEKLDWARFFGNDSPVELEIGSGKGLFLVTAAAARPGHNFLGIELARKYAKLAAERAARRAVTNVRVWPGDARSIVARRIPEVSLHAVHVYFPDPWWKKRHKKRRVFNDALVEGIFRSLEPGGELHVATDVEEYFGVILELIGAEPRLVRLAEPTVRPPEHDLDYLTNFERKFRIEGRAIYRAAYRQT